MAIEITDPGQPGPVTRWLDAAFGGASWRTLGLGGDKPAEPGGTGAEVEMEAGG